MVVYYIKKEGENLADYRYPIKEGDICMLYDGEVIKTVYIDSELDSNSIWRDFKFIDTKSLKSYQFPTTNSILCAPIGDKHAIGDTGLLTQLIKECKGEWLLDFLNETSAVLSGFVDYWDLEILRRLTGDDDVEIAYENEEGLLGEGVKVKEKDIIDDDGGGLVKQFQNLSEEIQLTFNIEYYSFLKKNSNERKMFKEICSSVYDMFDKIVNHPIKRTDISPSFAFIYDNFLSGLKISLMSEEGSMELIDKIGEAIELLRDNNKEYVEVESKEEEKEIEQILPIPQIKKENTPVDGTDSSYDDLEIEHVYLDHRGKIIKTSTPEILPEKNNTTESRKGKTWTEDEERLIKQYFLEDKDFSTIAELIGRTEVAIKSRLAKLGLIEYTYVQDDVVSTQTPPKAIEQPNEKDFTIENSLVSSSILNKYGKRVFSTDGKFKYLRGKLYRLYLRGGYFTVKNMQFDGIGWRKGVKKIVAYSRTELFGVLEGSTDYCRDVEDIVDAPIFENCKLKVKGVWYSYDGNLITDAPAKNIETRNHRLKHRDVSEIMRSPLYAVKRQALLRALDYFRLPASIRDIARTISRTAWRTNIIEEEVEEILSTMSDIVCVDGKYILRKRL